MSLPPVPKPSITEVFTYYGATVVGADRGSWQKATCALLDHDDKSPSASVNESECKWHCWTCDTGGDAVDLVMRNEACAGYSTAARIVERIFGTGDEIVRTERGSSSLLPGAPRHKQERRAWRAPWLGL